MIRKVFLLLHSKHVCVYLRCMRIPSETELSVNVRRCVGVMELRLIASWVSLCCIFTFSFEKSNIISNLNTQKYSV